MKPVCFCLRRRTSAVVILHKQEYCKQMKTRLFNTALLYLFMTMPVNDAMNEQPCSAVAPSDEPVPAVMANLIMEDSNSQCNARYRKLHKAISVSVVDLQRASCGESDGCVEISVAGEAPPFYYEWSDGISMKNRQGLPAAVYSLTVSDALGRTKELLFDLNTFENEPPELCAVSVDQESGKNALLWSHQGDTLIEYYTIYRYSKKEIDAKLFVPVADAGYYIDFDDDPSARDKTYRISSTDICGQESGLSEEYSSLHMQMSVSEDGLTILNWNSPLGVTIDGYQLQRSSKSAGFKTIASLSSRSLSYIDDRPPSAHEIYRLACIVENRCTGGGHQSDDTLYKVYSNTASVENDWVTIEGPEGSIEFYVYPVPARKYFVVNAYAKELLQVTLFELSHKPVLKKEVYSGDKIDVSGLSDGIYFIEVSLGNQSSSQPILIK